MMEMLPSSYDPLFSYAKISCKNGAQRLQHLRPLNFDVGFEFRDFEKPHDHLQVIEK